MRAGAVVMLVVAVLLGGLSVFAARGWIERQVNAGAKSGPAIATTPLVVARTKLQFGDHISSQNLKTIAWPKGSVPAGAFSKTEDLLKGDRPRVALQTIEPNEPVLKSKISGFGGRASLSAVMKGDHRAVTIRVNDITGVAGFLLPGDHVDILMTRQMGKGHPVNTVLLQNVRILGVGQISNQDRNKPVVVRAVTVEATPLEAQKLTLAQDIGRLSLVLRPITDDGFDTAHAVDVSDLTDAEQRAQPIPAPVAPKAVTTQPAPKKRVTQRRRSEGLTSITIVRGLAVSKTKVPNEGPAEVPRGPASQGTMGSHSSTRGSYVPSSAAVNGRDLIPLTVRVTPGGF